MIDAAAVLCKANLCVFGKWTSSGHKFDTAHVGTGELVTRVQSASGILAFSRFFSISRIASR